jgi:hypothetical protein
MREKYGFRTGEFDVFHLQYDALDGRQPALVGRLIFVLAVPRICGGETLDQSDVARLDRISRSISSRQEQHTDEHNEYDHDHFDRSVQSRQWRARFGWIRPIDELLMV